MRLGCVCAGLVYTRTGVCNGRKEFERPEDRNLFGTEADPIPEKYSNFFRWPETDDEYLPYCDYSVQGNGMIYCLNLPDSILEKVYHKSAEKLFSMCGVPTK
jgi:hypothetical protein